VKNIGYFRHFFSQVLAESGPKKGRHWENSEEQFCPSFLKTPDKFFFSDMEKHAKPHMKLSILKMVFA
jgi:hypothetical protein